MCLRGIRGLDVGRSALLGPPPAELEAGDLGAIRLKTLIAVARTLGVTVADVIPTFRAAPAKPQDRTPRVRGEWAGGR